MKLCKICKETKEITEFVKSSAHKDGYQHKCKLCWNAYRRNWTQKNSEKRSEQSLRYYYNNRDYYLQHHKDWRENNREQARSYVNTRRKRLKQATPPWQDIMEIVPIYREAQAKGMEVDHIVPLNNPTVCGLHVPWNLQLLSHEDNMSKGNKFYG